MKLRVSIFAFFISTIAIAQPPEKLATHEDSIRILKQLIRERELVASAAVGFALQPAPQWYSFAYLLSLSTNDEVLQMTKDSSACLRFYSYIGLIHRKHPEIKTVEKYLSADNTRVHTIDGCIGNTSRVNELIATGRNWYAEKRLNDFLETLRTDKQFSSKVFNDLIAKRPINLSRQ